MDFKNGIKNIQAVGYNDACTVYAIYIGRNQNSINNIA